MTRFLAATVSLGTCLALAGCLHGDRDGEQAGDPKPVARSGTLAVDPSGRTSAAWVEERRLRLSDGRTQTLADAANGTLIATLAPLVVPDAAGTAVAYNSWRERRPTLRVRDLRTRSDTVLAEGAHAVAWASEGALAYFEALKPDLGHPRRYLGHVVVRQSRHAAPRPWTPRAGRYVVAAWARGHVLYYRLRAGFPDLLVLDRPRRQRPLARAAALVAVSPDGRRVFVSRYGSSPPLVRVVDVASGAEVARLQVDRSRVPYVVESGSWVRDLVFAATTTGIAVFRVRDDSIELAQVLRAGADFAGPLVEPRARPDGQRVVAWGELQAQPRQALAEAALVECDRLTLRCVTAARGSSAAPPRPLYNPSRP